MKRRSFYDISPRSRLTGIAGEMPNIKIQTSGLTMDKRFLNNCCY
ncbi:MAG: hypothetical protein ABF381_11630 [Akkermansiaceae bacterium]